MIKSLFSILRHSTNSFEGQREGEKVILLSRRHYFTIMTRLGFFGLACLVPIAIILVFYSYLIASDWLNLFLLISGLWYLGFWLAIFRSLTLYTLDTLLITNYRVIDSNQNGFFDREVSELQSHRIQDVSIHTNGMIETFLKFGDITVQTAASEKRFVFHQIPNPDTVKDVIMQMAGSKHSGVREI
jgi:hypothetical protein